MRFKAVVAAVILMAAVFGVSGSHTVQAASQPKQVTKTEVKAYKKPKPKFVTVKPGDYLEKIAKSNHTTYPRLFNANPKVKDPDLIYPGQKLRVPDSKEKLTERMKDSSTTSPKPKTVTSYVAQPSTTVHYSLPANSNVWDQIAQCESGGNWSISTGNGFYGGLQFTLSSWRAAGGSGFPNQASKAEQITRAQILQTRQGWGAWPACTAKLGLR